MSNIAVIKLSGAQHLVKAGDRLEVNRLNYDLDKDILADVLLSTDGDKLMLNEGKVLFKVIENKKGKKLSIVKFRAKSRYRRRRGHRQSLSVVEILSINGETKPANTKQSAEKTQKSENEVQQNQQLKSVKKGDPKK